MSSREALDQPFSEDAVGASTDSQVVNESTRLLETATSTSTAREESGSKIPIGQLFGLCYAAVIDVFTYFIIFPFVPSMVQDLGVPQEQLGYYCGIIESVFSASQFVAMLFWSRVADRLGRKPVLCWCLLGMGINAALFGTARKIWQMVLYRACGGIFAAATLTIRVMTTELTTPATAPQAFANLAVVINGAFSIAPLIGGALYNPTQQYPALKSWTLLREYPALLPCSINGLLSFGAVVVVLMFCKETKAQKREGESQAPLTYKELLSSPGVVPVLTMALSSWAFGTIHAIVPTFFWTDIALGGWQFSARQISFYIAYVGCFGALFALFILPKLSKRYGNRRLILACGFIFPTNYAWYIVSNRILRSGAKPVFWCLLPIFVTLQAVLTNSNNVSLQLAINSISPKGGLSIINGLVYALIAAERSILPGAASSIFAWSVERQILRGSLLWAILFGLTVPYLILIKTYQQYL